MQAKSMSGTILIIYDTVWAIDSFFVLLNLKECMCSIDTFPQNNLHVWGEKSVLFEKN